MYAVCIFIHTCACFWCVSYKCLGCTSQTVHRRHCWDAIADVITCKLSVYICSGQTDKSEAFVLKRVLQRIRMCAHVCMYVCGYRHYCDGWKYCTKVTTTIRVELKLMYVCVYACVYTCTSDDDVSCGTKTHEVICSCLSTYLYIHIYVVLCQHQI